MYLMNYKEVPECICVQTKFITKATAQQYKLENIYYINGPHGTVDLTSSDSNMMSTAYAQLQSITKDRKSTAVGTSSSSSSVISMPKPLTITTMIPNINIQPAPNLIPVGPPQGVAFKTMPLPLNAQSYNTTNIIGAIPMTAPNTSPLSIPFSNPIQQSPNFNSTMTMKSSVLMKDAECMTDTNPECIDREQQTLRSSNVASVGIQCNIEDEFDAESLLLLNDATNLTLPMEREETIDMEDLRRFVKEHSVQYKNNLRECQICGEVCKGSKETYEHMAVHRGPKCLCFLCGDHLEHEALISTHNCVRTERHRKALLRCPYKRCKVVAISRLELYDHLNEHIKLRIHGCTACGKSFCTVQEFLRHLLLRAKCYTEAKRNRNRLYGLRSRSDQICRVRVFTLHSYSKRTVMVKSPLSSKKTYLCEMCFRTYRSKYLYNCHIKKCGKKLRNKKRKRIHKS